jgi:two-component system, OmpR family, sensor histidine kinase KdpD
MCERFFRGTRHAAAVSGSGLGLWIASAFVSANGGRIEASSGGPGRGATVSIHLPIATPADQPEVSPDE